MATSTSDIYVWTWLPGSSEPVPAGLLRRRGDDLRFRYSDRYAARTEAISLYGPALPLQPGVWFEPQANLHMPGAIRDASPDNWGRRVIVNRTLGQEADGDTTLLDEGEYLLRSASNRLGAIDFQSRPDEYELRGEAASLTELYDAAELVQAGTPLTPDLDDALLAGTAIGGARPKALLASEETEYIAKFSTSDDPIDVVGAEAAATFLASHAGIPTAEMTIVRSLGRKALLLKRFDRPGGGRRHHVVSALTLLDAPETFLPYGSYPEILDALRTTTARPEGVSDQIFRRVAFNIAVSNTDDHLRNHAAFWDGRHLELTPAYDLSPASSRSERANQALAYSRSGRRDSNLGSLLSAAADYGLSRRAASAIVEEVRDAIHSHWDDAAEFAQLTTVDKQLLWRRQILHPSIDW